MGVSENGVYTLKINIGILDSGEMMIDQCLKKGGSPSFSQTTIVEGSVGRTHV